MLIDYAAQPRAIGEIVDLAKLSLIAGDILRPLSIVDALRTHGVSKIVHTAFATRKCREGKSISRTTRQLDQRPNPLWLLPGGQNHPDGRV
jgi:hypothetical protein